MCDPTTGDQVAAVAPRFDEQDRFRARSRLVLFVFVLWFLLIVGRMAQFMVVRRAREVSAMTRESVAYGQIPALRGRLLDPDGNPLAWSVRRMRLLWSPPVDAAEAAESAEHVRQKLPWLSWPQLPPQEVGGDSVPVVLTNSLEPAEVLQVKQARLPELRVEPYVERRRAKVSSALLRRIGTVAWENGVSVGLSGLEREHNALLAGQAGVFRVVVDKYGHWVPETWHVLQPMQPGYDVHVAPLRGGR
jgi:cell division protein FtsI/penicillin-binding protein 2